MVFLRWSPRFFFVFALVRRLISFSDIKSRIDGGGAVLLALVSTADDGCFSSSLSRSCNRCGKSGSRLWNKSGADLGPDGYLDIVGQCCFRKKERWSARFWK